MQKSPLKLMDIWAIRARLQVDQHTRGLPCSILAWTAGYRGSDLVSLLVRDVCHGDVVAKRSIVVQAQNPEPKFGLADHTRQISQGRGEARRQGRLPHSPLRTFPPAGRPQSHRAAPVAAVDRKVARSFLYCLYWLFNQDG